MFKKSTMIKAAAIVFCAGVLLTGIGTGVAIAEYTSLEYTGEHILGEEKMKTEDLDFTVERKDGKKIRIWRNYRVNGVHYREDIPMDTIRYTVTYNPDLVSFWINYEEFEEETAKDLDGADGMGGSNGIDERGGIDETGEIDERGEPAGENSSDAAPDDYIYQGGISLQYYYTGDEFDLFMRNKDKILDELKHGKFGAYRVESIKSVEVWMNPGMQEFVELS